MSFTSLASITSAISTNNLNRPKRVWEKPIQRGEARSAKSTEMTPLPAKVLNVHKLSNEYLCDCEHCLPWAVLTVWHCQHCGDLHERVTNCACDICVQFYDSKCGGNPW
jgi:hypothetical protein